MRITRTAVTVSGAAVVVAAALTGCTTAVSGAGRPAAPAASATGSSPGSAAASSTAAGTDVPNGAPAPPADGGYESQTPWRRSWLFAFDASTDVAALSAQGVTLVQNSPFTVQASYGRGPGGVALGTGTLTVAGAAAEFRTFDRTFVVEAPAGFWIATGLDATPAGQAADRWVAVDDDGSLPVTSFVELTRLLITFEPEQSDSVLTGTEDGGATYVVTNATDGYTTLIGHDSGRITGVRTSAGTLVVTYPDTPPEVAVPDPAEVVSVAGVS